MRTHNDALPDTERLTNRDGCDCSEYVERCAHLGDYVLRLAMWPETAPLFNVVHGENIAPHITRTFASWNPSLRGDSQNFATKGDALTAFYEAEERLLRGEL